jgi:hypothetical protein
MPAGEEMQHKARRAVPARIVVLETRCFNSIQCGEIMLSIIPHISVHSSMLAFQTHQTFSLSSHCLGDCDFDPATCGLAVWLVQLLQSNSLYLSASLQAGRVRFGVEQLLLDG